MPTHIRHGRSSCPTACSLDVLGDKWTLLIIREALGGTTRFGDYWRRIPGLATTLRHVFQVIRLRQNSALHIVACFYREALRHH